MSNHKKNHQHNNNHTLQQLAVGLQPLNLNVLDTPPVFTFTVTDYSSPEKPADIAPTQTIFSDIDGDGSKSISKDEFIREMTKKNRQDAFREFFAANDTDGSGALTADEIRKFASEDSEASVEEILAQCDANSDGKITLEEFLKGIDG